jgi:hypothetical protein
MSSLLFKQIEICFNEYVKNHSLDFANKDESNRFEILLFETFPTVIQEIKRKKVMESEKNWKGPEYLES